MLVLALANTNASGQVRPENPYYARKNSFGVFGAYSPDSSHMLLGYAENRKLVDFGVSYNRRLIMGNAVNWQFSLELLPVALESDPVAPKRTIRSRRLCRKRPTISERNL